ncbi:MAG: BlaI/MecI/CopY family transcriptional regulator [Gemmatimonadetes bacterium]|nr:BlaI/MecI/CopY family transcriptional regulator [Gemmatimonadota bacterium]MCB9505575.1 BlaI/MecI/CopY family transcriptional regulator [Gemmatimonadales bacterium]MCA9761828.1 BlaI/MecI/CopY family transcriptional regulator [Gemmatimonadota bacterium]MCA9768168.1 BlaI/MecI/CopY family transcriptional regulator [Gemmatimonadota bacterium]MCB9518604.1 BlaI/MecI/CopY family transcriptional regulator [Gemmatimonadales bacterium]
MAPSHDLTELQIAIMRLLWSRREATVAEVWEALYPERGLAQTTIATLLTRLERRGVVARRVDQRQYVYRPLVTESEVQQSMVGELTERLFSGDVTALVSHLLTSQDVAPGDLARLRELVDAASRQAGEDA